MGRSLTVAVLNRAPATHSETTGSRARTPVEDDPKLSTGSTSTWKFPGCRALENNDSKKTGRVAREQAAGAAALFASINRVRILPAASGVQVGSPICVGPNGLSPLRHLAYQRRVNADKVEARNHIPDPVGENIVVSVAERYRYGRRSGPTAGVILLRGELAGLLEPGLQHPSGNRDARVRIHSGPHIVDPLPGYQQRGLGNRGLPASQSELRAGSGLLQDLKSLDHPESLYSGLRRLEFSQVLHKIINVGPINRILLLLVSVGVVQDELEVVPDVRKVNIVRLRSVAQPDHAGGWHLHFMGRHKKRHIAIPGARIGLGSKDVLGHAFQLKLVVQLPVLHQSPLRQ